LRNAQTIIFAYSLKKTSIMRHLTLFVILCCTVCIAYGQKTGNFDGKISYDIEYSGEKADMMSSMAPSSYIYLVRGDKMRVKTEGGMASAMAGDVLVHGNEGKSYMLKDDSEKALRFTEETSNNDAEADVEELDATKDILGYQCNKYKVTTKTEQGEVTQFMWVAPDLSVDIDEDVQTSGAASNLAMKKIDGLPLQIKSNIPMASMKMTMTAKDISWEKIDQSQFTIPDDYSVEELDKEKMKEMGGMR
jgi:hypothetical protein